MLLGLGTVPIGDIQKQGLLPDIYDQYLNGVGTNSWRTWNSPDGAYVQIVAKNADTLGATPMFTLYQMAALGDSNLSGLNSQSFMQQYWDNVRLLFTQLKTYGKPALVNLEPDFWGYAQRLNNDPTKLFAYVGGSNPDCANQPSNMVGVASCLVQMARQYAPKAYIGFPPATWSDLASTEMAYMKAIGADKADFVVMQTLDRDIGCMEASYTPASCNRPWQKIWDENNVTSPNFKEHFTYARGYADNFKLPVIWWQTPLGQASTTAGGTPYAFRDNRVKYFLTHPEELVAAGGLGVVFSPGPLQTTINTDGGQYKARSSSYLASPVALP